MLARILLIVTWFFITGGSSVLAGDEAFAEHLLPEVAAHADNLA